jgi:aldehyde dehydrogenase (NAD+)
MTDTTLRWDPHLEIELPALTGSWINGAWSVAAGAVELMVEDPGLGQPIAAMAEADTATVDQAVSTARAALNGEWGRTEPAQRGRIMTAIAAAIRADAATLATLETVDTGKPLSQSRGDVETSARYFEYYAGVADKILGETLPQPAGTFVYTLREPVGVVAHITPWNSPMLQLCRGVAPSLAAGNTVVVKPAESTPLSSLHIARLFERAGLPVGVCNVLVGRGPTTGADLVRSDGVDHVTFTGSVLTGQRILALAADRILPCNLELGGKSPTIVMADCDLAVAARTGAAAVIRNSGQSCFATTRLLVQSSIHERFLTLLAQEVGSLSIGHGLDDRDLGPLSSQVQLDKVLGYVESATAEGATVLAGGDRPETGLGGYFINPTVLSNVHNSMRVAQEEVFGPVQSVLTFDTEDEAVAIANDSIYGLAAGVFTQNLSTAHRLAARLQAGQIQVNRYPAGGVDTPFGGYKRSGMGREKGLEALRYYTQLKTVIMAI